MLWFGTFSRRFDKIEGATEPAAIDTGAVVSILTEPKVKFEEGAVPMVIVGGFILIWPEALGGGTEAVGAKSTTEAKATD